MLTSSRMKSPHARDDLLLYRISCLAAVAGTQIVRVCKERFGITGANGGCWHCWRKTRAYCLHNWLNAYS